MRGSVAHGWLAALGLTRALSLRWPDVRLRWDGDIPILTGGPSTVEEAAGVALGATVAKVPTGGVLPGADPDWPAKPAVHMTGTWAGLVTPAGLLHPLLHPLLHLHAAQSLRGVIDAARRTLSADPDLMLRALQGLGLDSTYGAGLWLLRHDEEPAPRASAGRDWLALMALPWMPARDDGDGGVTAPGWITVGARPVLRWWLWQWPHGVPAHNIPSMLAHDVHAAGCDPVFAAQRRRVSSLDRYRPPYMVPAQAAVVS